MIGKLTRVPVRDVWPQEANLTRWLEQNIDLVGEAIGVVLASAKREQQAGDLSVDLVAQDEAGRDVVIENQFYKSDHDHLGKLVTYTGMYEARAAIWVVEEARQEHRQAVAWLNKNSSTGFYLLEVEAVRIGTSEPAPNLKLIAGPSLVAKKVGREKRERVEAQGSYARFWTDLLEYARDRSSTHARLSPSNREWLSFGTGRRGLQWGYYLYRDKATVEVYVDLGANRPVAETKALFDRLFEHRADIERVTGQLEWKRNEQKRACRIRKWVKLGGFADPSKYADLQKALVEAMIKLEAAFRPYLDRL